MAVKIRLRRAGSRNKPYFRIVVADGRSPIQGRFIESVGWYDPKREGLNFELNSERIDYWVGHGAQVSDTVRSFIKRQRNPNKPFKQKVVKEAPPPAPPAEEAPAEAVEAEAAPAEAEVAAEEAPATEEAPAEAAAPEAPAAEEAPAEKTDAAE